MLSVPSVKDENPLFVPLLKCLKSAVIFLETCPIYCTKLNLRTPKYSKKISSFPSFPSYFFQARTAVRVKFSTPSVETSELLHQWFVLIASQGSYSTKNHLVQLCAIIMFSNHTNKVYIKCILRKNCLLMA